MPTWTDGRCELADGVVLFAEHSPADGMLVWVARYYRPEKRLVSGEHFVGYFATERDAQVAAEKAAGVGAKLLARNQPCGCVICNCIDDERCHGCGAKSCGAHPVSEIPNPAFADDPPQTKCATCDGHGCIATTERDQNGENVETWCPTCNPPTAPLAASVANTAAAGWATVEALRTENDALHAELAASVEMFRSADIERAAVQSERDALRERVRALEGERDEARESAAAITKAVWRARMDEEANIARFGVDNKPSQIQKELARIEGLVQAHFDMAMGWVDWPELSIELPSSVAIGIDHARPGSDASPPSGRLMCLGCMREFWLDDDGNEMPGNPPPCKECE